MNNQAVSLCKGNPAGAGGEQGECLAQMLVDKALIW